MSKRERIAELEKQVAALRRELTLLRSEVEMDESPPVWVNPTGPVHGDEDWPFKLTWTLCDGTADHGGGLAEFRHEYGLSHRATAGG